MTYLDAQPRANEIKDSVLSRRMPPWGAIKGFGSFGNDQSLTQEQTEIVRRWVDGGIRRGNNPRMLPAVPDFATVTSTLPRTAHLITGAFTLRAALILTGLIPETVPQGQSLRIVARLPSGHVEPLAWLYGYDNRYRHPFLFRRPLHLPTGTVITGIQGDASISLLEWTD